jgi:predicted nucleic acid-binding protein
MRIEKAVFQSAFLGLLWRSPQIARQQVTLDHLKRAEEIYSRYRDKSWSFTDCVSFAFMEERGLEDVFAFDENFSQFGLRVHPAPHILESKRPSFSGFQGKRKYRFKFLKLK